jgi:peptidoglycan hydrolase-like protein with peptidoglycan-binding domain
MKDGLFPVVAVAGAVSVALIWSMSANDPYWRLVDAPSVPALAYDPPEGSNAVLDSATLGFGNIDAGAISPAEEPTVIAQRTGISPAGIPLSAFSLDAIAREAEAAAIPEPMIALVPPFEPVPMTGPAFDLSSSPASGLAMAFSAPRDGFDAPTRSEPTRFERARFQMETDLVVAFAPTPLPAPATIRDHGAAAVAKALSENMLDPFIVPAPPAQPRFAADESTEEELTLAKAERIDVQRRLALAGFNPNGFDGTFGPRTRGAIADFQTAWGFPATGYLESGVYADLNQRTENAYQALRRQAAAAPSGAAPELAPVARQRQFASAKDEGRCARRSDGRIIERQSLACDLAGFGETFVSLGRNTLNDEGEESGNSASAPGTTLARTSGADR